MQRKESNLSGLDDYRESHSSEGYGEHYLKTYQSGYYAELWRNIERPLLESIFDRLRADGSRSCLDFACGTGRVTQVAEEFFDPMVGVDVSEQMLSVAAKNCRRAELRKIDVTRHGLHEKFDVVTAFRFFLNADPLLKGDALKALRVCLHQSGVLLINVHVNHSSILGIAYRLRNKLKRKKVANTLSLSHLDRLLREHGFRIDQVHWYGFYPRTGWAFGFLSKLLLLSVERIFTALGFLPRTWAQCFIVEARRVDEANETDGN